MADEKCEHPEGWIVDPPPGKHLRICTGCYKRLIECTDCDAKLTAGPHVHDSEWMRGGQQRGIHTINEWTNCPPCHIDRISR